MFEKSNRYASAEELRQIDNVLRKWDMGRYAISDYEEKFLVSLDARRKKYMDDLYGLSTKQLHILRDIESKFELIPRFLADTCEDNAESEHSSGDLYIEYQNWAKRNGERFIHDRPAFEAELQNRGYDIVMRNTGWMVQGIRLLARRRRQ
jgi:phage/plasmid-associated DNA primase